MPIKDGSMEQAIARAKSIKRRRAAAVMDLVKFIFDIMQTVSFMMFIEEEAIQIRGFGIMSLIREDLTEEVATQVDALEGQCNNLENFIDGWGWAAPYIRQTYVNYVQATRDEIDAWRAWVVSREAIPKKEYGARITSLPSGAMIYIDGTNTQKLTPETFYNLSPGDHTFKLKYFSKKHNRHLYAEQSFPVSRYDSVEHRIVLTEMYTGLKITSSPSNAEIRLDNTWTYKLTPHTFYLSPGTYRFKLIFYSRTQGSMTYEANAEIKSGEIREVRWILD